MRTSIGDLWSFVGWKVIPTNLTVNKDELAVMGRGVAKQAADMHPHLREEYGIFVKQRGFPIQKYELMDTLYFFPPIKLILLPVKYHWREPASLPLIARGVKSLSHLSTTDFSAVALPLLGCGFGELEERVVRPLLEDHLDDRFTLVLRNEATTRKYQQSFQSSVREDRSRIH